MTTEAKRLVIVGGGVAGLEIATRLGNRLGRHGRLDITLIDKDVAHIWKPMLHTVAAGTSDVHREQVPFLSHAKLHGFRFWPGEIAGLDRARKLVHLAPLASEKTDQEILPARDLPYDFLVIAVGSRANDFATKGVAEHCHVIDSRIEANDFNIEVRSALLRCVVEDDSLRIAIVGGGATGVELAAGLAQLLESGEAYGAPNLRAKVGITLIDSGKRLLMAFPESVSIAVSKQLQALGVEVRHQARVAEATADGFVLDGGSRIPATVLVWAAGVKGADCLSALDGLEISGGQQLIVGITLQTKSDEAIFAVGDCASLTLPGSQRPLPPTAQVAHQQAAHFIRHFPAWLEGTEIPDFRFHDFGSLVSLGRYSAFGSLGKIGFLPGGVIRGRFAQFSHAMLYRSHQVRLHGVWRGTVIWTIGLLSKLVTPSVRVD